LHHLAAFGQVLGVVISGPDTVTFRVGELALDDIGMKTVFVEDGARRNEQRPARFPRKVYRRRNVVERCINSLKWFRRVATRYEKLATNYLAMVTIAIIFRLLS
jgi:hypothetical protein